MELAQALEGLDEHPWADASHAYGTAEDLPGVLRALAGGDAAAAEKALSELYGSVLHQGTVYAASADVAPFLARIAAAGHRSADVLALLGGIAGSQDAYGVAPGAIRAAVAAQLPLMLPMLSDTDPATRRAAAWAVAHTREADAVLPALRARWEAESEPVVRAELLGALTRLDPVAGAAAARTVLGAGQPARLRIAAVFACLDAGQPWTGAHHEAAVSLLPLDPLTADRLDLDRGEPLSWIAEELLRRDTDTDRAAAGALLDAAVRDARPEVRAEALWAADRACHVSRSAPERLLPALLAPTADAASVPDVLPLLGKLGPLAAEAAPALAATATGGGDGALGAGAGRPAAVLAADDHDGSSGRSAADPGDADLADQALAALVLVAPAQAAPLLARGLGRSPRALDAAAGLMAPADAPFPFDAELLDAVRARLAWTGLQDGEVPPLTRLLRQWGAPAAPALPELYATLPRGPQWTAPAIAAVAVGGPPEARERAAAELRAAAGDGALVVARALYELIGESAALLEALAKRLTGGTHEITEGALAAGELGAAAAAAVPALRAALGRGSAGLTSPELDADVALASALWRITQDAETVVPALESVLVRAGGSPWFRWSAMRAARTAALLGPAGRPLVARLEELLGDPEQVPVAVLALVAVTGPETLDRSALAGAVLGSVRNGAAPMEVCDALEALGPGALTPGHLGALTELAEGDLRVIGTGLETHLIRGDDRLRLRVRDALTGTGEGGRRP
ncbi:HEAT repeat domain-containing protein [Streptomyces sp. NPDC002004]